MIGGGSAAPIPLEVVADLSASRGSFKPISNVYGIIKSSQVLSDGGA